MWAYVYLSLSLPLTLSLTLSLLHSPHLLSASLLLSLPSCSHCVGIFIIWLSKLLRCTENPLSSSIWFTLYSGANLNSLHWIIHSLMRSLHVLEFILYTYLASSLHSSLISRHSLPIKCRKLYTPSVSLLYALFSTLNNFRSLQYINFITLVVWRCIKEFFTLQLYIYQVYT